MNSRLNILLFTEAGDTIKGKGKCYVMGHWEVVHARIIMSSVTHDYDLPIPLIYEPLKNQIPLIGSYLNPYPPPGTDLDLDF